MTYNRKLLKGLQDSTDQGKNIFIEKSMVKNSVIEFNDFVVKIFMEIMKTTYLILPLKTGF